MARDILLEISDLKASYGEVEALKGIQLSVRKGEITCLLGKNGMGKSTIVKCVCGMLETMTGKINFDGNDIVGLQSFKIARLGVGLVPEGRRIFARLTVEDNLRLGASVNEKGKNFDQDSKDVYDLLPVLKDRLSQRGGTLSGGEQQMLAIGRAMMARPSMLLLDEPSLGIAPKLVNQIFSSIKNINKEKKVTVFLVEQNAKKALELADRGYVLVNGKISLEGAGKDLLNNPDVQACLLYTSPSPRDRQKSRMPASA